LGRSAPFRTVGTSEAKELYNATVSEPNAGYVLPFIMQGSTDKGSLLVNKQPTPLTFNISGVTGLRVGRPRASTAVGIVGSGNAWRGAVDREANHYIQERVEMTSTARG
jgi:hypothetical protein